MKKTTSVVLCTYNRAHLLKRSLICYTKQTLKDFELIILDDNSQDETEELVKGYKDKLNIIYIKLEDKKADEWRDAACIINRGIKLGDGNYIYITHPEVMPCFDCLEKFNAVLKENHRAFVNSRTYYMTFSLQEKIDTADWQSDFYNIKKTPGFYDEEPLYQEEDLEFLNKECTTKFAETTETWHTWVFGGMTRKTWKYMGGLNEYRTWGSVDVDFMQRRQTFGVNTLTPKDVFVIHQNHDSPFDKFTPTKRSMKTLLDEVQEKYDKKIDFLEGME